jgi:hypothetical protein
MAAKDKAILNLCYIRALGDILNECAGHDVELSTNTLTALGGQVVDLAEQAIEALQKPETAEKEAA